MDWAWTSFRCGTFQRTKQSERPKHVMNKEYEIGDYGIYEGQHLEDIQNNVIIKL